MGSSNDPGEKWGVKGEIRETVASTRKVVLLSQSPSWRIEPPAQRHLQVATTNPKHLLELFGPRGLVRFFELT